jgi:hypothetical protein
MSIQRNIIQKVEGVSEKQCPFRKKLSWHGTSALMLLLLSAERILKLGTGMVEETTSPYDPSDISIILITMNIRL